MMIFQNRDREDEKKMAMKNQKQEKMKKGERKWKKERERDMCVNECVRRTDRVEDQSF